MSRIMLWDKLRHLREIESLDPVRDHLRIIVLNDLYEFPWDTTRALEFALFRTYASPSISRLLDQTQEFYKRPQKRYDDTSLLIAELYIHGYDSERGRAALRNMNRQHGQYEISNEDFLYVMSTFVFEPIRWMERFGWRKMSQHEKIALFEFWRELGKRMAIREIPETLDAFEQFNRDYERTHFIFAESNRKIGSATVDLFLSWFVPRFLYPLGRPFIYAMLDDVLIEAFGFPKPPGVLRWLTAGSLKLRAKLLWLLPPRRKPSLLTEKYHRSYPKGYTIEQFGPPEKSARTSQ